MGTIFRAIRIFGCEMEPCDEQHGPTIDPAGNVSKRETGSEEGVDGLSSQSHKAPDGHMDFLASQGRLSDDDGGVGRDRVDNSCASVFADDTTASFSELETSSIGVAQEATLAASRQAKQCKDSTCTRVTEPSVVIEMSPTQPPGVAAFAEQSVEGLRSEGSIGVGPAGSAATPSRPTASCTDGVPRGPEGRQVPLGAAEREDGDIEEQKEEKDE